MQPADSGIIRIPMMFLWGWGNFVEDTSVECTFVEGTLVEWNIGRKEHLSNGPFVERYIRRTEHWSNGTLVEQNICRTNIRLVTLTEHSSKRIFV